jgi:glucose/arabinose dehydrogenase
LLRALLALIFNASLFLLLAPPGPGRAADDLGIRVPPGFAVALYAQAPPGITALAFSPQGVLYAAEAYGRVWRLGPDGEFTRFAAGLRTLTGLLFVGDDLYVSQEGALTVLHDRDGDGQADERLDVLSDLPTGQHQNNGPALGRDGRLYLPVGTTCNACVEADPRSGTVLSLAPDGSDVAIVARGLRNVYQLAVNPVDGSLWGADNGRDELDLDAPEELNLILPGHHYGWPDCWGRGRGPGCAGTTPPVLELEPHGSANGLLFYTGDQFPSAYRNDLFVTLFGQFVPEPDRPIGQKVVRVTLTRQGEEWQAAASDFATGFRRPLAIAQAPDGSLLVGDFADGRVYQVRWQGPERPARDRAPRAPRPI